MNGEAAAYADALREIIRACAKPFGKDARAARRIALEALRAQGRATPIAEGDGEP